MSIINKNKNNILEACIFIILLILCIEIYGNNLYSGSQDLENHVSFANYILTSRDVSVAPFMSFYPPLSHYMVVVLSPLFDNLISSFTKISILVTFLIYYVTFKLSKEYSKPHIFNLFFLLTITNILGFGIIGNEVITNYFFPQLVSTLIAVIGICIIAFEYRFASRTIFYILLFSILIIGYFTHPSAIMIIFGSYLFKKSFIVLFTRPILIFSFVKILILAAVILLITYLVPYNRKMSDIALHNGHLAFGCLADVQTITPLGYLFIFSTGLISLFCLSVFSNTANKSGFIFNYRMTIASALAAGSSLSLLHVLLEYIGKSTLYAAKKNFFFNWTFLCILLSIIATDFFSRKNRFGNLSKLLTKIKPPHILPVIFSFLIIIVLYRGQPLISVYVLDAIGKDCIKLQESLGFNARQRTIVELPIGGTFNYLLSSCYLNYPNRNTLWHVLSEENSKNLKLHAHSPEHSSPAREFAYDYIISSSQELLPELPHSGKIYNYNNIKIQTVKEYIKNELGPLPIRRGEIIATNTKNITNRLFSFGISIPEKWGVWSDGSSLRMTTKITDPLEANSLLISVNPFIFGSRTEFDSFAELNGRKIHLGHFSESNYLPQTIEIPFLKEDLDSSCNLVVDLHFNNVMPFYQASGLNNGDVRRGSFGFVNISLK